MTEPLLYPIPEEDLFQFLITLSSPVMETVLIKRFIKEAESYHPDSPPALYQMHFSVYHALYKIKRRYGPAGYYLHLDPMRIRLLNGTRHGRCCHYHPLKGEFCPYEISNSCYCRFHERQYHPQRRTMVYDPLEEFYLNPENIQYGDDDSLQKIYNGIKFYIFRRGEVEEALQFFGLTNPGIKIIRRKYYQLARQYHPDINGGDETPMKKLNQSYEILREVYRI